MKVVIVGAGVGGLVAAKRLSKHRDVEVTLIDKSREHDFAPSFLWLLDGTREAAQVSRPLSAVERWGVELVNAEVTGIDVDGNEVETADGPVRYDELVLAPGAELAPESVPGFESAHFFYTKQSALELAGALREFKGGRVAIAIPRIPYKCPAAPYEAAFLIDAYLRRRGVEADLAIHTIEPQPMPVAGPKLGARVVGLLEKRGIAFLPQRQIETVDADNQKLMFDEGDDRYDLLIGIPPHRAPAFVRDSALAGPAGWVPVDDQTLHVADHVHAVGDVTAIQLANGKPLPKAGVFAHGQAHVVADNLVAQANGRAATARFSAPGACFLETGSGKAGVAFGRFYATPDPRVRMLPPARLGHLGKALFERWWLKRLS